MTDTLDPLILDLVEWVARQPRPYAELIEVWRTSCPRLTVWEEARDRGLVDRVQVDGLGAMVIVAPAGRAALRRDGRSLPRAPKTPGAGSQRGTGRAPGPAAPSTGSA